MATLTVEDVIPGTAEQLVVTGKAVQDIFACGP